MINWLRTKVQGLSYSEIAQYIMNQLNVPLIVAWILDAIYSSYAEGDARESCMAEQAKLIKNPQTAEIEDLCNKWAAMQDFLIPDPILWTAWVVWVLMVVIHYQCRKKPYPLGPNKA